MGRPAAHNPGKVLGVYGGTFDPVHEGHLGLARHVRKRGLADTILFVPAARPPHKGRRLTGFPHRVRMLEIALAKNRDMAVSTIEATRRGPSYTVDTLAALKERYPDRDLLFLAGMDSLLELPLWYRYPRLLELADLVVAVRGETGPVDWHRAITALEGNFRVTDKDGLVWRSERGGRILILDDFFSPYSSTRIRETLENGEPQGVPGEVLAYIRAHGLYTSRPT